jgi:DNA-binding GntR family transcriptional regulator
MGGVFKAEKRSILVEQVANQIREAIKSKKLKSGERLIETVLASGMETGRNAVREAIRYLEKEGLVTTTPFKGAQVTEFAKEDLDELYDLRIVLEELAIRTLVRNIDREKIARLESVVKAMKGVTKKGSVEEIIDVDLNFHRTICELSGNRRLLSTWLNLSHQLRAFIGLENQLYDDDTPETTLGMHYPVFEAIKKGDGDLAVKRMREVITRGHRKASKYYTEKADGQDQEGKLI